MSVAIEHFRLWLRTGMTGCDFAKRLATKAQRISIDAYPDAEPPSARRLNGVFEAAGTMERVAIVVFPQIESEAALVDLLNALAEDPRWVLRKRASDDPSRVFVALEWTTAAGDVSEAMGFAPLPTMPVPRRAPYFAIGTWPGGPANPFRGEPPTPPRRPGQVSFLDAAHGIARDVYDPLWQDTSDRVRTLVAPREPKIYRRAAFVLSSAAEPLLRFE